ncbi:hypothetical protein DFJ74DRAFT_704988 [Hyaloraphidium curvatum]|nr:hypothetical protein DFJ74DRAFT_704988 [Hyaloraphidium curvatum]
MSVVTDEKHQLGRTDSSSAAPALPEGARRWLVCLDGSELSEKAFSYAASKLARKGDQLIALAVLPDSKVAEEFLSDAATGTHQLDDHMEQLVASMRGKCEAVLASSFGSGWKDEIDLVLSVRVGDPGPVICDAAGEYGADGVVCSSRGLSGWQRLMLGSVSTYLVHHAPRPVVVVREDMS